MKNIQPDILLSSVRRDVSTVCYYHFQGSFSPEMPVFERSEYIELKLPSLPYTFIEEPTWDGSKRLAAEVVFLSKMEVTNPTPHPPMARIVTFLIVSYMRSMINHRT
jgi:hypothetical protein